MKFDAWVLPLILCACLSAQAQSPAAQKRLDAELLASDGHANDCFGANVAADGNIVAVADGLNPGSVYLYSRLSKGSVTQTATLNASDGAGLFAVAVGENGRLVVAGAPNESIGNNPNQGAIYVFVEPSRGWAGNVTETAVLTASDGAANDFLGGSVSTTNGVIVAGAAQDGADKGPGKAYVYVEPQGGWITGTETGRLTASNGQTGDFFGGSVAVYGPRIIIGADLSNKTEGVAYVFQEPIGGWKTMTETAQLSHPGTDEFFAESVAASGKTVLIGAPNAPHGGAAYIYIQPANGWVTTETPNATLTEANSGCLGDNVAIESGMIAAGDPCIAWGRGNNQTMGDAIVYLEPNGGWQNSSGGIVIRPFRSRQSNAVAVGENRVIIGADMTNVGNNQGQGAAFIYTILVK